MQNLDSICRKQREILDQAKVCQRPFDSDGFPVAFSTELKQFEAVIKKVEEKNQDSNYDLNGDTNVQSALATFMNQMPLSNRTRQIQQEIKSLFWQAQKMTTLEEVEKIQTKFNASVTELSQDPCYLRTVESLGDKFPQLLIF